MTLNINEINSSQFVALYSLLGVSENYVKTGLAVPKRSSDKHNWVFNFIYMYMNIEYIVVNVCVFMTRSKEVSSSI